MQHSYFSPYVETYHVPFVGAGSVQELSWLSIFLRIWLQWRPLGTNGQILSTNPLPPISVVWSSGQYFLPTNCWSNVNRWSNVFMIFFAPRIFNWPIFAVFFHSTSKVAVLLAIRERLTLRWAASDASAEYSPESGAAWYHTESICGRMKLMKWTRQLPKTGPT